MSIDNLWRCRICLWGAVTTATRARNTCNNAETVTEALIFVHLSLSTIKRSGNESSIITDTQFLHLCNLDLFWDNRSTFCCRVKMMVLNQNWENEYTEHSVDIMIYIQLLSLAACCSAAVLHVSAQVTLQSCTQCSTPTSASKCIFLGCMTRHYCCSLINSIKVR